jgi:hypothetical protein
MIIFVHRNRINRLIDDGEAQNLPEQRKTLNDANSSQPSSTSRSTYRRFKIDTCAVPPRRKLPRPFTPRVGRIGLASNLIREVFEHGFKLRERKYRRVLLTRPCIYGVFSGRFGGFHPIRDRCTGCMRCVQEFPQFCRVDRNPEFFRFADSYWIPEDPTTARATPASTISYEAATGKIPIKGMGYKEGFAGKGWDSMWTDMSEIVRPTRDGVYGREYISTLTDLGRKPTHLEFSGSTIKELARTVEVELPIIFDYLPDNLNSQSILRSIANAAGRTGTLFVASSKQTAGLLETERSPIIPLLSPAEVAENLDRTAKSVAIELTTYDSDTVGLIRKKNPTAPISIRLPLTENAEQAAVDLVEKGVDVIHLLANYHGEGRDSKDHMFVKDYVRAVHRRLVKESLRDQITIIASGGITLAEHVPKAIACGTDLVGLDTTVLVALQVEFLGECRTQLEGRIKRERFNITWGQQRLVNLLASWHDQLIEVLSAMGMRDVRRLRGDVGRAMFNEDLEKEAFADIIHGT